MFAEVERWFSRVKSSLVLSDARIRESTASMKKLVGSQAETGQLFVVAHKYMAVGVGWVSPGDATALVELIAGGSDEVGATVDLDACG